MEIDTGTIKQLDGLSLSAAFRKFVLEDSEVSALGKEVICQEGRHREVFAEGQIPGLMVDFKWPIDLTATELAFRFVSPPLIIAGAPLPQPSDLVMRAAAAVSNRLGELRRSLIDGVVVGKGTFVSTGTVGTIDRLQWARAGVLIDVESGDFLETVHPKVVPRWTGIALEIRSSKTEQAAKNPRKVVTKITAQRACKAWLIDQMRANPNARQGSKDDWWDEAQSKWPHSISRRAFDAVWAEAVRETGAFAWSAAGAPRKSSQQSPR